MILGNRRTLTCAETDRRHHDAAADRGDKHWSDSALSNDIRNQLIPTWPVNVQWCAADYRWNSERHFQHYRAGRCRREFVVWSLHIRHPERCYVRRRGQ